MNEGFIERSQISVVSFDDSTIHTTVVVISRKIEREEEMFSKRPIKKSYSDNVTFLWRKKKFLLHDSVKLPTKLNYD